MYVEQRGTNKYQNYVAVDVMCRIADVDATLYSTNPIAACILADQTT